MLPYIFTIGGVSVPSFFIMIMLGTLAATFFSAYVAKRDGLDPVVLLDFGIMGIIASMVGARVFHIVVENPAYYLENPVRVFYFWQGGFVSLGAFIFTFFTWRVYIWKRKLNFWQYIDVATVGVPLIKFFVRLGCLLVGCCYGKPTDFFVSLTFTDPKCVPAYFHLKDIPLHATQLYNMLNTIIMFFLFLYVYKRKKFHGQVFSVFLIYYGVSRFLIEFLRGDVDRGMWFNNTFSTGQVVMMITFVLGIVLWVTQRNKKC